MNKLSEKLYSEPKHHIYLSIFRIYICFHILKKILFQWPSLDMLYGMDSFAVPHLDPVLSFFFNISLLRENYIILVYMYMTCVILYAFGVGKHFTAFAVYFFLEIFQRLNGYILNGGDNYFKFLVLYMAFCNSYEYLSIHKLKIKSELGRKVSNLLTNLATFSICLHLCLIYFITGLHKAHAKVWFTGVATYYTLSLERFMGTDYNSVLATNGYLVTLSSYATVIWELYAPILVWIKRLRVYVLLCGVALHCSIYMLMMIHDFQIIFIMVYGFFFTDEEWSRFFSKIPGLRNVFCGEASPESESEPVEEEMKVSEPEVKQAEDENPVDEEKIPNDEESSEDPLA